MITDVMRRRVFSLARPSAVRRGAVEREGALWGCCLDGRRVGPARPSHEGEAVTKIMLGVVAGLVAGAAVTWIVLKQDAADDAEARKEAKEEESHVRRTDGQVFVRLDREGQHHAGLKTAPLEVATLKPEVKAYGRVLDPAALSTQMVELAN